MSSAVCVNQRYFFNGPSPASFPVNFTRGSKIRTQTITMVNTNDDTALQRHRGNVKKSFLICANPGLFLFYFRPFLIPISITTSMIQIERHRWCAWDSNPGRRMVGADETTKLWRPPNFKNGGKLFRTF